MSTVALPQTEAEFMEQVAGEDGRPHGFMALMTYAILIGVTHLNKRVTPGEAYRFVIDSRWVAWFNPHTVPAAAGEDGATALRPCYAYVEYNGWPAGIGNPWGFEMMDHEAEGACNPESFARDLWAASQRQSPATSPGGAEGE